MIGKKHKYTLVLHDGATVSMKRVCLRREDLLKTYRDTHYIIPGWPTVTTERFTPVFHIQNHFRTEEAKREGR